jgi:DNA polymerase-3 subunit epsilon
VQHLQLERSLVVFDLESTGTDPASDRIVELSVLRIDPDGTRQARTRRIHPGRPIPAEATAVHGIRDEDVRDCPTFRQIARGLLGFLGESDLAGFNVLRFDVPLLDREFRDCGMDLGLDRRRVVDVMTIFHRKEPRDLAAAVRLYLGREHAGAHSAAADVEAAAAILDAEIERYGDLPRTVAGLAAWCSPPPPPGAVDREGKFVWRDGQAVFDFGRYQGRPLREVVREAPDYLEWIVRSDFPEEARGLVARALCGEFPRPPGGGPERAAS